MFASGPTSPLTLSAMKKLSTTVCYLCGKPLVPSTNVDHPIMQQIFAPEIRRKHNISRLIQSCNTSYKRDEDYFVRTLIPFARGSEAGNAIYAKALNDYRIGKQVPLTKKSFERIRPKPKWANSSGRQGSSLSPCRWRATSSHHIQRKRRLRSYAAGGHS